MRTAGCWYRERWPGNRVLVVVFESLRTCSVTCFTFSIFFHDAFVCQSRQRKVS